jgi:hypothetical protein
MMLHEDGSNHKWAAGKKWDLIVTMDDATSKTRSEKGLKTRSIIPSLMQTAKRQGVHLLTFLKTLLTTDAATAQAALHNKRNHCSIVE